MRKRSISKFKLHSIPILHKSKCLQYVSYSIPLTCMMALLLLISSLTIVDYNNGEVYAEEGISTYATTPDPTVSLTIGGDATNKQVIASPGSTAYRSHTVTVDASDIEDYSLILSGPTNLVSGTSTVVAGAENKTPTDMKENTWGYSWGGADKSETTVSYQTLSPGGTGLLGDRVSGFSVNFTKNLFFAVKFAEDAEQGRYQANVQLALTATPRAVATGFGGIYNMQDMTEAICDRMTIGATGRLEDIRDGNVYSVAKLSDGNCWMTRNLALTKEGIEAYGGSAILTDVDSNVKTSFVMPASITKDTIKSSDFYEYASYNPANYSYKAQIYSAISDEDWHPAYGAYYSFTSATAGTGNEELIIPGANAPSDICPKGWSLPTGGYLGNYGVLYRKYPSTDSGAFDVESGLNGYWLGAPNVNNGGAFFTAAGSPSYGSKGLGGVNIRGTYWTRTVGASNITSATPSSDDAVKYADAFSIRSGVIIPAYSSGSTLNVFSRAEGHSVRCIVNDNRVIDDIADMQEMTPNICANTQISTSKSLRDSRDGSYYTVTKLEDGNCWMTQNLRLVGSRTLTSSDSDVTTNYTLPASSNSGWNTTNALLDKVLYPGNSTNGAYYTWCTATAGTCKKADGAALTSGAATSSICPKGFRLPTSSDFSGLISAAGITNDANGVNKIKGSPYTLPTAGYVSNGNYSNNSNGYYWASGSSSNGTAADMLYMTSSSVATMSYGRWYGQNVRCVAR